MEKIKRIAEITGLTALLGVGSVIALVLLAGFYIAAVAGPIILVLWAVKQFFF
jgi:hypothetical protein